MKKNVCVLLENSLYFKIMYLLLSVCTVVPIITQYTSNFFKILLVYAFFILLYTFFIKRTIFNNRYTYIIIMFLGVLLLSILMNYDKMLVKNIKGLYYLVIQFFILAYIDFNKSNEEVKKEIFKINHISVIAITIISLVSFLLFVFGINGTYYLVSAGKETVYYIGVAYGNRLTGIAGNPNTLGMLTILGISGAFINGAINSVSQRCKTFYFFSVAINFICFIMSSSRGAELGFAFWLAIYLFFKFLRKLWCMKGKIAKSIIALTISFAIVGGIFLTFPIVRQALGYIPAGMTMLTGYRQASEEMVESGIGFAGYIEKKHVNLYRETKDEPLGGGRVSLWKAAIKVVQNHPIFGVGKESVSIYARRYSPDASLPGIEGGSMHNIIIETIVSYGIMGLMALLFLIFVFARDSFSIMYREPCSKNYYVLSVLISSIIMLFANNMAESSILYSRGFMNFYFVIHLGYLMYFLQFSIRQDVDSDNPFERLIGEKCMTIITNFLSKDK